ncbi:MAG: amidohydrolase [Candidatus Eremiobacteraeota bacterium]|nr:amidohydrolase [Candidatus Eremiobacteraeota bacterium]
MVTGVSPRLFHARKIIAQNGSPDRETEAFVTLGERIVATGGFDEVRRRFPTAEIVNLEGVVVPGFNDAHAHLSIAAEDVLHLDLSPKAVGSLAALTTKVREQAARTPPGTWIRGSRYDDAKMAEGRVLERADLDAAASDHPALILHVAGHWGVVNSRALALGGIDESTQAPEGGAYGRDAAGRLNGILYERALFEFAYPSVAHGPTVAPASTLEERLRGLGMAQAMFHAAGITSLGDALCGPRDLELLRESYRRGVLTLRVSALIAIDHYDAMRGAGIGTGFGDDRLRIGGFKAFVDGAIGGRTCLLEEPFEGTEDRGMQTTPTPELREIVRKAQEDGERVCVHCNGDAALRILLNQFEAAAIESPRPGLRHRIEHCSVVNETIVERIKRLEAYPVPFAGYIAYHGHNLAYWYGDARLERMFAHAWFQREGVPVAGSSDYPCGPLEPLYGMQSMVTRRGDDGALLGTSQKIDAQSALSVYTLGSAAAEEHPAKGRLAPGYLADFVVLDDDPTTVDPSRIAHVPVRATYVGAERVFAA